MIRSRETTRFALSSSSTSRARCCGPVARNGQAVHADYERPENTELQAAARHAAIVLLHGAAGQWRGRGWDAPTKGRVGGEAPRTTSPSS